MPPKTSKTSKTDADDSEEQPAWARNFEARLIAHFDDLQSRVDASDRRMDEFMNVQKQQGESIASNSQSISNLRQQHTQNGTLLASLRENVASITSTLQSSTTATSNRALPEDTYEFFTPEELCTYYASVSSASPPLTIDSVDVICSRSLLNPLPVFSFRPVTSLNVQVAMQNCKSSSCGSDGIPATVMRLASQTISDIFTKLTNVSFETGVFPSAWKLSSIVPLSKKPSPTTPSDTRPISLLPELSKVLERLAHTQLTEHLSEHDLLDTHQHDFKPTHSTQTAFLDLTESVRSAIDDRKVTLLVSFNFSKAFDTIDHSILLSKLHRLGYSHLSLKWFASYLSNRQIAVQRQDSTLTPSQRMLQKEAGEEQVHLRHSLTNVNIGYTSDEGLPERRHSIRRRDYHQAATSSDMAAKSE
uniref:Reverse transcriptase domain-containing protein n=1 Tax=Trichogramma kaykai TaxID=54128 RepID=A0ABD2XBU0_9HYME